MGSFTNKTGFAMAEALSANKTLTSMTLISRHPQTYFFGAAARKEMHAFMRSAMPSSEEDETEAASEDESPQQRKRRRTESGIRWMTDKTVKAFEDVLKVNNTLQRLELGVSQVQKKSLNAL